MPFLDTFPTVGLTGDEIATVTALEAQHTLESHDLDMSRHYYEGLQPIENLRIAIPQELESIRTIVGWAATAVDPIAERLSVEGFRSRGATEVDPYLMDLFDDSEMDAAQTGAYIDALTVGRCYWLVARRPDGSVRVTAESARNVAVQWSKTGEPSAAILMYREKGEDRASLYLPDSIVTLGRPEHVGQWSLIGRTDGYGFVPIRRMANRATVERPDGSSEITRPLRSIIDMACSVMLQLRVAGELYSVPKEVLLGATESAFQNADGTPRTAWQTYVTRIIGLERDEEGNTPELRQLQAYDPSVYTRVLEHLASQAAGILAAPPQDLGIYTTGNPVTAESASASESRRDRKADARQREFSRSLAETMKLAIRLDKGSLPDQYAHIRVDWGRVGHVTDLSTSQAIQLQIGAGAVPATSDVTLKRLGYDALDRQRLAQDRVTATGEQALQEIARANQG